MLLLEKLLTLGSTVVQYLGVLVVVTAAYVKQQQQSVSQRRERVSSPAPPTTSTSSSTSSAEKVSNAPPDRLDSPPPSSYYTFPLIMATPVDSSQPPAEMQSQQSSSSPGAAAAAAGANASAKPAKPQQSQPAKQQSQQQQSQSKGKDTAAAGGDGAALSPAELKKKAKAEKAARRARERAEREQSGGGAAAPGGGQSAAGGKKGASGPGGAGAGGKDASGAATPQKGGHQKQLPRRGSAQATGQLGAAELKKKQEEKNVSVFGHLYGQQRRTTIAGAGKEVHPAVLALGMQMRDYVVCGSSARCVATLLAFKRVIEAYTTPLGTSLARHLTTHLSHQITYLSTCRPLSISQGNAIRALKLAISSIDPSVPEATAKASLCDFIDSFIREKITVADQVIAGSAAQKIQDGDVIVTFAGSSIVKQTLLAAHKEGKQFRVSIIDSRPLFEGKNLARTLANAGLDVQYSLMNGISHAIKDATKVFLGAHAMTSNGRLYSRVGTALVAMSAKERAGGVEVPVIVCCETVKFTDRVALDSIVVNEIADADELVTVEPVQQLTGLPDPAAQPAVEPKKGGKASSAPVETSTAAQSKSSPLEDWKESANLQLLNIMYDVTPAEYVDMVVTEMGSLPPSAVPIVHRMSTNM
ncbi:probable translation initiation factor eIF-2B subunit delta [Aspergillus awamori]|uniref:Translation initiation factor eIF2B subunit delta n=1 Tax=Aspergillus awamori TaxID=105351 RepID=A0A401KI96_ASPAW|nr:probable translation initiation factor eIF-2B subunit delta [Aspergillus awamori]GKZ52648.1 eukaryotic translation initiation factor 2B, subunit 4 delta, 67kDa [Aspergillus niger]GLA41292.1 eukaryotic translation initiation factor 2B, subunit 4 delta, 67kDa [Aspergillus niger]